MRAYLVTTNNGKKYCGTQAEVASTKRDLMATGHKRNDITVKEVEIPMAKADLLEFINNEAGQSF